MTIKAFLEQQADTIERTLADLGAPGAVTGGKVTPWLIRYTYRPAPSVTAARVRARADDVALALGVQSVRVGMAGAAMFVEVPRPDPATVDLAEMLANIGDVPPVTAILGIDVEGYPLLVRLPSPTVAHVLVAGTTGSGKTALLRTMILSLVCLHPRPSELALVIIDPRGGAGLGVFANVPHLISPLARHPVDAQAALNLVVGLMEKRDREGAKRPPVVVVIDELADLVMTGGPRARDAIVRLAQRGRGAGIHLIAATQKPSASALGPLLKANFPVRIVGRVTSPEDARVAAGRGGTGAERLAGWGEFLAISGDVHRFRAAYMPEEEMRQWLAELRERMGWPDASPPTPPLLPAPLADDRAGGCNESGGDDIEALARRLAPWWRQFGGQHGAKTAAVKYLFGPNAPAGGYYWDLTMRAITIVEESDAVQESTASD